MRPERRETLRLIAAGALPTSGLAVSLAGCLSGADEPDEFGDIARRGEADPIAVASEPSGPYEYRPESDTVVYEDGDEMYELPFAEWATREAAVIGSDAVSETLAGSGIDDAFVGRGRVTDEFVETDEGIERDADSGVVVEASGTTGLDAVVAAAPRRVSVTLQAPEREYAAVLPVLCRGESAEP